MMSPETIKLMAQTYEECMKVPYESSRPLETMRRAYQQMCAGENPWSGLGSFSHAWYGYAKDKRAALVAEPLAEPAQETQYTRNWAAYCAASVEYLCGLYHLPCPTWVQNPRYILSHAWSGSNTFPAITEQRSKTTPLPFARRNIFCGNGMFRNKYELFEWMLEAQRNGLTDPRAIRDYARQKEISLHGA